MRAYDIIDKKKRGIPLSAEEIGHIVSGYVDGSIPDYQMAAFLMAVYFQGMTSQETAVMTDIMARSGDMVDLSPINGIKVDKHSTGGVGDKTTLIISPIVAACGVKVAKMSGRALGHSGGTVDKLESIPGIRMDIERERFFDIVNDVGVAVIGQSGNLAPADKKIYALRDVTATVDSIPLIATSIMSKKLAAGSDAIVLDVKYGSGAFMTEYEDAMELARIMVDIGESAGKSTVALVTNMDVPLGNNIGNSLEVTEAIDVLKGEGPEDLTYVSKYLAVQMLLLAGKGNPEECEGMVDEAIASGRAYEKFKDMVIAQGGDGSVIEDPDKFEKSGFSKDYISNKEGYIQRMNTLNFGIASSLLGAGRETKDSEIDYGAGIVLKKKTGDYIRKGDVLATLYASEESLFPKAENVLDGAYTVDASSPEKEKLIYAKVTKDGVFSID